VQSSNFTVDCAEKIGVDVEHREMFAKAMIIKKKHNFGVTSSGEIKLVGIEDKKNDRPAWVNYVFDPFFEDFLG
jgi:hypothetical protein